MRVWTNNLKDSPNFLVTEGRENKMRPTRKELLELPKLLLESRLGFLV